MFEFTVAISVSILYVISLMLEAFYLVFVMAFWIIVLNIRAK